MCSTKRDPPVPVLFFLTQRTQNETTINCSTVLFLRKKLFLQRHQDEFWLDMSFLGVPHPKTWVSDVNASGCHVSACWLRLHQTGANKWGSNFRKSILSPGSCDRNPGRETASQFWTHHFFICSNSQSQDTVTRQKRLVHWFRIAAVQASVHQHTLISLTLMVSECPWYGICVFQSLPPGREPRKDQNQCPPPDKPPSNSTVMCQHTSPTYHASNVPWYATLPLMYHPAPLTNYPSLMSHPWLMCPPTLTWNPPCTDVPSAMTCYHSPRPDNRATFSVSLSDPEWTSCPKGSNSCTLWLHCFRVEPS